MAKRPAKRLTPLKDTSPAYQKRIRSYAKRHGITVQQARKVPGAARGHKPQEHVTRKIHAEAKAAIVGGLTSAQRAEVRKFAREQASKIRQYVDAGTPDALVQPMLDWATREGYERFQAMRKWQRGARRQFKEETEEGSYESRGEGFLIAMAEDHGAPDYRWMFYHT